MGYWTETCTAVGPDQAAALAAAKHAYQAEYGWSHDIREVSRAELVRKVPPLKKVSVRRMTLWGEMEVWDDVPDTEAPEDKWLEEWQFEFLIHA